MAKGQAVEHASGKTSLARWNRTEVNRYLLPVLHGVDTDRDEELTREEQARRRDWAIAACAACPEAYRQMLHVYRSSSPQTRQMWFGWIECEQELLDRAFDLIERALNGETGGRTVSFDYEKDMYFASLFRINDGERAVDLSVPFEQYYFCDEVIYRDYLFRRLELADHCKSYVRRYLPYYNRILAWYRDNLAGDAACIRPEYSVYMDLLEHFMKRIAYEDRLRDERAALEYERGGLGWFRRRRKREIDAALRELAVSELEMKLEDAEERYRAYEAQFDGQRDAWQNELAHAPLTAFGRRKELKLHLAELEEKLENYRTELRLEEMKEQYRKMTRS